LRRSHSIAFIAERRSCSVDAKDVTDTPRDRSSLRDIST
jgi:hypothetical protein